MNGAVHANESGASIAVYLEVILRVFGAIGGGFLGGNQARHLSFECVERNEIMIPRVFESLMSSLTFLTQKVPTVVTVSGGFAILTAATVHIIVVFGLVESILYLKQVVDVEV